MPTPASVATTRRARSRRATANDGVLIEAACRLLVAGGWDALTTRGIAAEAGLSARPAYARFPDRVTLACTLWQQHGARALHTELAPVITALMRTPADIDTAAARVHSLMRPSQALIGCAELMGAAVYLPELRAAISNDWSEVVELVSVGSGGANDSTAARVIYASAASLGLLLTQRDHARAPYDVSTVVPELIESLSARVRPRKLPPDRALHMDYYPFSTGDPRLDDLLEATLFEIAEVGYHAATIERICQRAGVTQGFVFGRYSTKLDIFINATERRALEGLEVNLNFTDRIAQRYGSAIAEAVLWREAMRPEHQQARHWAIEQVRLAWHEPALRNRLREAEEVFLRDRHAALPASQRDHAMSSDLWGLAIGIGMVMIAEFLPESWRLPFDVVTVPVNSD